MTVTTSSPLPSWAFHVRAHDNDTTEAADHRAAVAIAYTKTWMREILHWTIALCTGGIYLLLTYWFPSLGHLVRYTKTNDIFKASRLAVISETGQRSVVSCRKVKISTSELKLALPSFSQGGQEMPDANHDANDNNDMVDTVVFEYRCLQFLLNIWINEFEHLSFNVQFYPSEIHTHYGNGVSSSTILSQRQKLYGPACVEVPIQPLFELIVMECLHPIYVFQICAIALWLWDEYYQYAGAIIVITLVSLCAELFESRRSQLKLQRMAKFVCQVSTARQQGHLISSSSSTSSPSMESQVSTLLVPGDVIEIYRNMILPCDVLLMKGSVIVNESMLTGESIPIIKNALPNNIGKNDKGVQQFNIHQDANHILFGGTEILGVRKPQGQSSTTEQPSTLLSAAPALGLVIRTGFCTTQGQMMRSILHPNSHRRSDFKYETFKFLGVLAGLAFLGAFLSLAMTFSQGLRPNVIIIRCLDTFTNAIPPALPATMTVGTSIAVSKLRRLWRIMVIAPSRINYAGQVNTFVFDKTGTLTEEGLDLEGVLICKSIKAQNSFVNTDTPITNSSNGSMTLSSLKSKASEVPSSILGGMASCHSVALIDDTLTGEPMETQLLAFTGWKLVEQPLAPPPQPTLDAQVSDITIALDKYLPCLAEVIHCPKQQRQIIQSGTTSQNLSTIMKDATRSSSMNHDAEVDHHLSNGNYDSSKCLGLLRLVRRFDFVPALQRMSVITWDRKRLLLNVVCKGSPEVVLRKLCIPSTIPSDLSTTLRRYTETGMRVIAIASKTIPLDAEWSQLQTPEEIRRHLDSYSRTEIESDLIFNGLIVFANTLKPDSRQSLGELLESGCRCIMATGDNALTATAVARDAALIRTTATSIVVGEVSQVPRQLKSNGLSKDAVTTMVPKITWTPVVYSPTLASLGGTTDVDDESVKSHDESFHQSSTKQNLCNRLVCCGTKNKSLNDNNNNNNNNNNNLDELPVATPETRSGTPTTVGSGRESFESDHSGCQETEMIVTMGQREVMVDEMNEQPFEDLRMYLSGKDPREVVVVLTGPAFRLMKELHESMEFKWTDTLLGEKQVHKKRQSCCARMASKKKKTPNSWHSEIQREMKKDKAQASVVIETPVLENVKIEYDDEMKEQMTLQISVDKRKKAQSQHQLEGVRVGMYGDDASTLKTKSNYKVIAVSDEVEMKNKAKAKDGVIGACTSLIPVQSINHVDHIEMSLFEYCLRYCRVYARMTPDDKALLINSLQTLPYEPLIGMCGDGANDCAALKASDVGLSLSDKEASIAAPFTSTNKTVQSAVDVLREGRGALTNSFQSFKFITLYALIQLTTVSTLYYYGGNLSDPQYLWVDLVIALPLAMTMAWTNASTTLSSRMPPRRLVGLPVILSIIGQILIQIVFMVIGLSVLSSTSFYERYEPDTEADRFDPDDLTGYENTLIFIMSNFQYITINLTMCLGRPWRKYSITNWAHTAVVTILIILSAFFLIGPYDIFSALSEWLSIVETPFSFRLFMVGLIVLNSLATVCFEHYVIIKWAVKKSEVQDRPSHVIDMALPLDSKQRVRFDKPTTSKDRNN